MGVVRAEESAMSGRKRPLPRQEGMGKRPYGASSSRQDTGGKGAQFVVAQFLRVTSSSVVEILRSHARAAGLHALPGNSVSELSRAYAKEGSQHSQRARRIAARLLVLHGYAISASATLDALQLRAANNGSMLWALSPPSDSQHTNKPLDWLSTSPPRVASCRDACRALIKAKTNVLSSIGVENRTDHLELGAITGVVRSGRTLPDGRLVYMHVPSRQQVSPDLYGHMYTEFVASKKRTVAAAAAALALLPPCEGGDVGHVHQHLPPSMAPASPCPPPRRRGSCPGRMTGGGGGMELAFPTTAHFGGVGGGATTTTTTTVESPVATVPLSPQAVTHVITGLLPDYTFSPALDLATALVTSVQPVPPVLYSTGALPPPLRPGLPWLPRPASAPSLSSSSSS